MRQFRRDQAMSKWRVGIITAGLVAAMLTIAAPSAWADANDSPAGASGPVLSGIYWDGAIETANDVDWYVFYSGASTATDIAVFGTGPNNCFGPETRLTDANGRVLAGYEYPINSGETGHILYTVGVGTFYVKVEPYNVGPCIGSTATYRLWINSNPALLSSPPYIAPPAPTSGPVVSLGCKHARERLATFRARLRRTTGVQARKRLRRNIRNARAAVERRC